MKKKAKLLFPIFAIAALLLVAFSTRFYSFLALPTSRVPADILIVEGWISKFAVEEAAKEFNRGNYSFIATAGQEYTTGSSEKSYAARAAKLLEEFGVAGNRIIQCPAPATARNRTSGAARAVRDRLFSLRIKPKGVNVMTVGPHARQTHLAYRRMMEALHPVGILTVPEEDFNPTWWWTNTHGISMVSKDFTGWLREYLFGLRK